MPPLPPHRLLHDSRAIDRRIEELARAIVPTVPEESPFVLACVLQGGLVFSADLARALARAGRPPRVELVWMSLYDGDGRPRAEASLRHQLPSGLSGAAVLVVDDILDTGRTLRTLLAQVAAVGPAWLRTCVLLEKRVPRDPPIEADYAGFPAPSGWVFGFGLDAEGEHRALPYLAVREP